MKMVFSLFKKQHKREIKTINEVDVCISNMTMFAENIYEELLSREDINLNEYGCTSNCSLCVKQIFVVVNEEIIKAKNEDQLREKLKGILSEQ